MAGDLKWTEAGLRTLKPTARREVLPDPITAGLVLLMTPTGTKTFYLVYRAGGGRAGKKKWFKIGRLGLDGGLEWARGRATVLRGQVQEGADPQGTRKGERTAPAGATMADLCARFIKVYVKGKKVAVSTGKCYALHCNSTIVPQLGHLLVKDVRPTHITTLLDNLTPGQASHVRSTLNRLFTRAMLWELRDTNPVKGQDKPKGDGRPGYRLTEAEIRRLGAFIRKHQDSRWQLCGLIAILALTGMRPGEILGSTYGGKEQRPWSDVDLKRGVIHLTAKAHKTGRQIGGRTVYLCREAVAVLEALPRDGDLVLGGWKNSAHSWKELRGTCDLDHVNLYDLRHTYISLADELVTAKTKSVLVGHASGSMSDHYTHKQTPELVRGAQKIGKVIGKMLGF